MKWGTRAHPWLFPAFPPACPCRVHHSQPSWGSCLRLVQLLHRYYGTVRLAAIVHHDRTLLGSPCGPWVVTIPRPMAAPPGSRTRCLRACQGSPTPPGLSNPRPTGAKGVAFRVLGARRHPASTLISGLNTLPARSPVNASPQPSPTTTHDSGPVWLAKPSLSETFTPSHLAGFPGAPQRNKISRVSGAAKRRRARRLERLVGRDVQLEAWSHSCPRKGSTSICRRRSRRLA